MPKKRVYLGIAQIALWPPPLLPKSRPSEWKTSDIWPFSFSPAVRLAWFVAQAEVQSRAVLGNWIGFMRSRKDWDDLRQVGQNFVHSIQSQSSPAQTQIWASAGISATVHNVCVRNGMVSVDKYLDVIVSTIIGEQINRSKIWIWVQHLEYRWSPKFHFTKCSN